MKHDWRRELRDPWVLVPLALILGVMLAKVGLL